MTTTLGAIFMSTNNEHRTPAEYVDAVRAALGGIELDPASSAAANVLVQAERFFTVADDALARPWHAATCFLNPPYGKARGKSNQQIWSQKLIAEYSAGHVGSAILLVNAAVSDGWFQPLHAYPMAFSKERIPFLNAAGVPQNSPTHGNAFVYFGDDLPRFARAFHAIATVVRQVCME